VRLGLEALVVARLSGRLTPEQVKQLNAHVAEEERARGNDEPLSIRLATEFHILLAEMTGSPVLARYVSENASRCGLTLALYSRPHSSECAVNEHRAIVAALAKGDSAKATALMNDHLEAVAGRALIVPKPEKDRDLKSILGRYGADIIGEPKKAAKTKR
jgi:DNA-binding GntR family transcriptional regulator